MEFATPILVDKAILTSVKGPVLAYFGCHQTVKRQKTQYGRFIMKWAGMYLVGFVVLVGGILAALWKLGILADIGATWTVIAVVVALGCGIMFAVSNSGTKENIQIDRK
jgi:hypothetical protein